MSEEEQPSNKERLEELEAQLSQTTRQNIE